MMNELLCTMDKNANDLARGRRCRLIMHHRIGVLAGIVKKDARTRRRKIWSRTLKNKLRCRRNVVDKYQVSRKCMMRLTSDCSCVVVEIITTTLNITQRSVTTSRPNRDNTDVEKLQLATFNKSHAVSRKRRPSPAVWERAPIGR